MKDRAFFKTATALLESRHRYDDTLWSYGVRHNDPATIREFLRHNAFAGRCGLVLASPLLTLDPVERFDYQHLEYARKVEAELKAMDVRVQVDIRNERMNQKIREAQLQKIPYMVVVGDKEAADNAVAVRLRSGEQLPVMPLEDFKKKIRQMITDRVNELKP